ncbi:LexA family transcriptional regulator [Lactococcus raffinolactis]|uniref:LexA family transcriptional regulator n=1 Tax=Pseudolactococcus raffinolactis TaxID=1366 RepID=UPI0014369EBA|nr:XRE family transcriptional regulator [Lactococcus raffinolactis]QIW50751.1 helix-turn-helix domain-containing protein [Lactococcus raffinolactis]
MENLLKTKRLEKRLTLEQVGKLVGVGKSTVRKWENGMIENMGRDKIVALSKALDISPLDILGIDKPQESTTKQILDNVFSKLETERQDKVVSYAQSELDEQNKENLVQLFPYNVQEKLSAGTGYGYFDDGNYDTVYYDEEYDYDYASWIFGDSMLPDYPNGDVALIKACPFEYDGCVYAVDWDGQSYIKKVYKEEKGLRLVSTNEKYSDKFAPYSEEPRIIGKVVASFTPLEK